VIEVELRLPTKHQYAYVGVKIQGETEAAVSADLDMVRLVLVAKITEVYNGAMDAVQPSTSRAAVKKAQAKVDAVSVDATPEPSAEQLIKGELGGTVITVTDNPKPWERKKPANAAALEDF
jgi:hypothetical protein